MKKSILFLLMLSLALSMCCSPGVSEETIGSLTLQYARQFRVDYLAGGFSLITIEQAGRFLLVPEGQEPPQEMENSITILKQPIESIYLAATSATCLFDALDALSHITMSGTKAEGCYIENARAAMESDKIAYAGKYSAPDYEMLMAKNCGLAIESTMIYHAPEVKEKLEELGIPVLVERSSYESHPLGRTEWIKLYGVLVGEEALAEQLFEAQAAQLHSIPAENTDKTIAFFYISPAGRAAVRKNGDYVTRMIELAGGHSVFTDLGDSDSAAGSVNLEMERFYAEAKEADVIIYNSSIDGEISSIDELMAKSHLIADFKAVKSGNVWCTNKNLFQETTAFSSMISDMHRIFTDEVENTEELDYF